MKNNLRLFSFLLTGIRICYPIKEYWWHCFTDSTFTYCTSTPLLWLDGKVYVRRPDGGHIFAWGKSGPSSKNSLQYSNCQRSIREGDEYFLKIREVNGDKIELNGEDCIDGNNDTFLTLILENLMVEHQTGKFVVMGLMMHWILLLITEKLVVKHI